MIKSIITRASTLLVIAAIVFTPNTANAATDARSKKYVYIKCSVAGTCLGSQAFAQMNLTARGDLYVTPEDLGVYPQIDWRDGKGRQSAALIRIEGLGL